MSQQYTILVADDEEAIVTLFSSVLRASNFSVETATNGHECIRKAKETNPDLILLDIHMPALDGYETIKELRKIRQFQFTPIVFLTGYSTSPANIEVGYELGSTEYWTKPINSEELVARVRSLLSSMESEKRLRNLQQAFNSMIVHDLRGPLGGVVGYIELMKEDKDKLDPEHYEMLCSMGDASKTMLNIITNFLELSRIELGALTLDCRDIDLEEVIRTSIHATESAAIDKMIGLSLTMEKLPRVHADPDYLEGVLTNILQNAFRFTPDNGSVTIATALTGKGASASAFIIITDTGIGIPPEDIPSLFDKNRILLPSSKRAGSRTGLSLPICRGIIEAHGGTIAVKSELHIGTSFTISLPIRNYLT
ncbi:MAG: hybrid sensor histidine kinase/response regulator [Ignavibacteriales bacterium]|nr:hybrid sensor histidine kinase/response regulator [Ignavibacteriales bacterium]